MGLFLELIIILVYENIMRNNKVSTVKQIINFLRYLEREDKLIPLIRSIGIAGLLVGAGFALGIENIKYLIGLL